MQDTSLVLGGKEFQSRLIVGTGKYPSFEVMKEAIVASGAQLVTVAVRRVNLPGTGESLLDYIDTARYTLLPNTAGGYNTDEAGGTAYLAREAGLGGGGWASWSSWRSSATPAPSSRTSWDCSRRPRSSSARASPCCRIRTTIRSWLRSSRTRARRRGCRWGRPSAPARGSPPPTNSN